MWAAFWTTIRWVKSPFPPPSVNWRIRWTFTNCGVEPLVQRRCQWHQHEVTTGSREPAYNWSLTIQSVKHNTRNIWDIQQLKLNLLWVHTALVLSWHSIQDSKLQWVEIKYRYIYLESAVLLLPSGPELMQQRTCLQHEPFSLSLSLSLSLCHTHVILCTPGLSVLPSPHAN